MNIEKLLSEASRKDQWIKAEDTYFTPKEFATVYKNYELSKVKLVYPFKAQAGLKSFITKHKRMLAQLSAKIDACFPNKRFQNGISDDID